MYIRLIEKTNKKIYVLKLSLFVYYKYLFSINLFTECNKTGKQYENREKLQGSKKEKMNPKEYPLY